MSDTASTYARLRAETAAMLGLDSADMSKMEGLRLDITSLLLLEIDSLQGSILANEKVDLARLSSALAMLQKLLPAQALVAPAAAADQGDPFAGAKAELAHFLAGRASAIAGRAARLEAADAERMADIYRREEVAACMAASIDGLKPAGGDARHDGVVPRPALIKPAAAVSGPEPAPASRAELERVRLSSRAVPPRRADESAWRNYTSGSSGAICPPGWTHPDERRR